MGPHSEILMSYYYAYYCYLYFTGNFGPILNLQRNQLTFVFLASAVMTLYMSSKKCQVKKIQRHREEVRVRIIIADLKMEMKGKN